MVRYFSEQHGTRDQFDLPELRSQLKGIYAHFLGKKYLAEWIGFPCVDGDGSTPDGLSHRGSWVEGSAGNDPASSIFAHVGRADLWPVDPVEGAWSEDQVLDMFQFLGTVVQKPIGGRYHEYGGCGQHPEKLDREAGLAEYREMVNRALARYGPGWELREDLSIVQLPPTGFETLVDAPPVLASFNADSQTRVRAGIEKFRRRGATVNDRRDAVRDLADVLELYKVQAKSLLAKDADDLFNIMNNFGVRHN